MVRHVTKSFNSPICRYWRGFFSQAALSLNPASAQNPPQPDNTKVNKQDRAPGAVTADQQKENRSDRDLTQQIRKSVMADKSLSTYAHNVKIIAQNGTVTAQGPGPFGRRKEGNHCQSRRSCRRRAR